MQRAMAAVPNKIPWLMIVASVAGLAAMLPAMGRVIREIEPGRNKPPDQVAGPEVPKEGPFITAHCAEPCRLGSYVKVIVGRTQGPSYLLAYAEDTSHNRVWYYPTTTGVQPLVSAYSDIETLSEALRLSEEHKGSKEWTLHLYLLEQPTSRTDAIKNVVASKAITLSLGEGR